MKQIRRSIFETNSSSTHSLTIVPKEEFEMWVSGELLFGEYENPQFIKREDAPEGWEEDEYPDYQTYDGYFDTEMLESFEEEYTTKSGDKIVVFGLYGRDG